MLGTDQQQKLFPEAEAHTGDLEGNVKTEDAADALLLPVARQEELGHGPNAPRGTVQTERTRHVRDAVRRRGDGAARGAVHTVDRANSTRG